MNILAFDTCFDACSVAVGVDLELPTPRIVEFHEPMAKGQAERLVPMVREALAAASLAMSEIDRIAVTAGPGTFTGTRIGVAAARALALATRCPVVAFSSLEVIARHPEIRDIDPARDLLVAMNANRGEAYVQLFDARSRIKLSEPQLLAIETAAYVGGTMPILVVGSAGEAIAAAANGLGRDAIFRVPGVLPRIGAILARSAEIEPLSVSLRPHYLRAPDAKPQTATSLARVP